MKEMEGGVYVCVCVGFGNWDMKESGERINHQVRRTTPPDWKSSRGFSLSLPPCLLLSLYFSHRSSFFFHSITSLRSAEMQCTHHAQTHCHLVHAHDHACMHGRPGCLSDHQTEEPISMFRDPAPKQLKLIETALCPMSIKDLKIKNSKTERGKQSRILAQRRAVLITKLGNQQCSTPTA